MVTETLFLQHLDKPKKGWNSLHRNLKTSLLILFILTMALFHFVPKVPVMATADFGDVSQQIDQLLKDDPNMQGAIAGISIRSAKTGKLLYDHLGDIRLRPASNLKLLTAAAALSVLGKEFTFPTEVLTDGVVNRDVLKGDLYLKGKGDPTLLKEDFDHLAKKLREQGIMRIKGNLIGDDSWYDDIRYSQDLPWSDETAYYGAQISALTASPTKEYDAGTVLIHVKPGIRTGDKATVTITPKTNYVKIINHVTTVSEDGKKELKIEREHAKNIIILKGALPLKSRGDKEWVSVWNPTLFALSLFKQSLDKQGIKLAGKVKTGMSPKQAEVLVTHRSMTLSKLLVPFMKLSNNTHAEILLKEMGKKIKGQGSWDKGLEILESEMPKYGVNPETMVLRDGSGVSHINLIPANQITQLLYAVQKEKWFGVYLNSLPVAGEKDKMTGGTLRYRMVNPDTKGKVFAKTGTISTVSSLSGYIKTKTGQILIFSILLNNLLDDSQGKQIEDNIVQLLINA